MDRKSLLAMGFPPERVNWALRETGEVKDGSRFQKALDHLIRHGNRPVPDIVDDPSPAYSISLSPSSEQSLVFDLAGVRPRAASSQASGHQAEETTLGPIYISSLSRFSSFLRQEQLTSARYGNERALRELEEFFREELARRRKEYAKPTPLNVRSDRSSLSGLTDMVKTTTSPRAVPHTLPFTPFTPFTSFTPAEANTLAPSYELAAVLITIPPEVNPSAAIQTSLERTQACRSSFNIDIQQIRRDLLHLYRPAISSSASSGSQSPRPAFASRTSIRTALSVQESSEVARGRFSPTIQGDQGNEVYQTFADKMDLTIQAIYAEYGLVQGIIARKDELLDVHHAVNALAEIAGIAEEAIQALTSLEDEKAQHHSGAVGSKRSRHVAQQKQAAARAQEKVVRATPLVEALTISISHALNDLDEKEATLREQLQVVVNEITVATRQNGRSSRAATAPGPELIEQLEQACRTYEVLQSRYAVLAEDLRAARSKLRVAEHETRVAEILLTEFQEGRFTDIQYCQAMKAAVKRDARDAQMSYGEAREEREKRDRIREHVLGQVNEVIDQYGQPNADGRGSIGGAYDGASFTESDRSYGRHRVGPG